MTDPGKRDGGPTFKSPWQRPVFVAAVAGVRRLLRPFGTAENAFIGRVVRSQNRRVREFIGRNGLRSILLILPRCLKRKGCPVDVRGSMAACRQCQCDGCPLREVAHLTDRFGVQALVAFRSHIAFAMARRERPDLILATACEDRLIKALRSVPEIPALLAPLTGMKQTCQGATLDLDWFESQLRAARGPATAEPVHLPAQGSAVASSAAEPAGKNAAG